MEELSIGGDTYRQPMAILVICPFLAGLQPVTWEGAFQEGDFSTSPPPSPTGRKETELGISTNHRDRV